MWIYTIINTMITGIITFPLYVFQKTNYYKEIDKMKDDIEILLKEIESLHKTRIEVDKILTNIVTTMRFTGAEWQQKIIEKKIDEVYKHHYADEEDCQPVL